MKRTGSDVTRSKPVQSKLIPALRLFLALILGGTLLAASGCARTPRATGQERNVRVAVLDGTLTYDVNPGGEFRREGWWFGSRDRYLSPQITVQIGDAVAHELDRLPGVQVYSRDDLAVYMAQKERQLRRTFPEISTSFQRKQLLLRLDPLDYGRSLNVDYVVSSSVNRASTVTNRTFSWWYSHLEARLDIWDVTRGELLATVPYNGTGAFWSQLKLAENLGRKAAREVHQGDLFRQRGNS